MMSKVYWLLAVLEVSVGGVTQGDPRQRLFARLARTAVTRVDQGAYMEEQFRMMQHAGPYPMTMPQAPPPKTNPPPAPGVPRPLRPHPVVGPGKAPAGPVPRRPRAHGRSTSGTNRVAW